MNNERCLTRVLIFFSTGCLFSPKIPNVGIKIGSNCFCSKRQQSIWPVTPIDVLVF